MILTSLLLSLSCLAHAETPATWHAMMDSIGAPDAYVEPQAPAATPPAAANKQLEAAPAQPDKVFDGQKAGANGLVVTEEHKNVVLSRETTGGDMDCDFPGDGRGRPICTRTPARTITTRGDIRSYKVVDRKAYEHSLEFKGALIGGLIGSLGLLLFLVNPLAGILGVVLGVAAGAAIGAGVGKAVADGTPDAFTRKENVH